MIKTALIMAAGRGARMAPLTDDIPKPMAPYGGSTLIAKGIDRLIGRIENIYVTVGYKKAMLAQHVIEHGANAVFNTEDRGNSWWLYNTLLRHFDEPICVLTADNVVDLDFDLLEEDYKKLEKPPCMLVPVKPVEGLAGDYIFHENCVVTKLSRYEPAEVYCSGIQILNPKKVNEETVACEDFYEVWQQLLAKRQLKMCSAYPKRWFTVDTMEQLATLNSSSF
ncbi:MAG TPA: NDP-sugar synthase [Pyrinomonadaceae bacterium]|jgi:NDP-sugar pyrophosphorylase family protein|nr:NDP-sugar synthase [Pyrinomonadaceae bacterium]